MKKSGIEKIMKEILRNSGGREIILIIDEWDFFMRKNKDNINLHKKYCDFLTLLIKR